MKKYLMTLLSVLLTISSGNVSSYPQTGTTLLEAGKAVENEIAFEQKQFYSVTAAEKSYLHIAVEQKGVDVAVTLTGPNGVPIITIDSPNGREGLEELRAPLETGGEYIIEVKAVEKAAPAGRYSVRLVEMRAVRADDYKRFRALQAMLEATALSSKRTAPALRQAIAKMEEAEQILSELGSRRELGSAITNKAQMYQILGDNDQAVKFYLNAVAVSREAGDAPNIIRAYNNIGFVYHRTSDYQNALTYLRLSLEEIQKAGLEKSSYMAFHNIGSVYQTIGESEKAVGYYNRALDISRKHGLDNLGTRQALGTAYSAAGDHQKGLSLQLEILPQFQAKNRIESEISILGRIAGDYFALKNYPKSLEYYELMLARSKAHNDGPGLVGAYTGIGKNQVLGGKYETARENLLLAAQNNVYSLISNTEIDYWTARNEHRAGNLPVAEEYMKKAVLTVESIRNRISAQDLRTAFFSKSNRLIYEDYLALLVELHQKFPQKGYEKTAFAISEKARARSLLELLAVSRVDFRQGIIPELLEKEKTATQNLNAKINQVSRLLLSRAAEDKIAAAKSEYVRAEEEFGHVQARIREASPHYAALTQLETVTLEETQSRLLDQDTALLEYSLGNEKSCLFVVTQNSVQIVELPGRAEIENRGRALFEALTARNKKIRFETAAERQARIIGTDAKIAGLARELSDLILAPAHGALNKKRLLIAADGILQYIPFGFLPARNRQPLIQSAEVVSLPSASALAVMRRELGNRPPAPKTVAVIADPVFSLEDERLAGKKPTAPVSNTVTAKTRSPEIDENDLINESSGLNRAAGDLETADSGLRFLRLPFTRREAGSIAELVPESARKVVLDFSASRANATSADLADYRIIHFATHSFLNSRHAELSGIVLSLIDENGKPQNGFLRTDEIYNLDLPAELVVLSGCRTGLGKEVRGEGLVGLTRGFMYAGAKRIAVSLWDVNDEATAELMARFYREMLGPKKLSPAAALRQAQLSMSKDKRWNNPYYWAGFILQGEPR